MIIWTGLVTAVNGGKTKKVKKKSNVWKRKGESFMVDKILRVNKRHVVIYFVDEPHITIIGPNALEHALLIAKRRTAWYTSLKAS